MEKSRWSSPVVWGSIVAQLVSILLVTNTIPPALGDKINEVAAMVLQLLVLFGVMNNPTDRDNF